MSEENIPSENSKKEILNSKQEEVTKNISQQETIEQTETQPETQNTNSKLKKWKYIIIPTFITKEKILGNIFWNS
jgi:hypothetical protein